MVAMTLRRYRLAPERQQDIREIAETLAWKGDFEGAPDTRLEDIAGRRVDRVTVVAVSGGERGAEDVLASVASKDQPPY
jgi:hypothetical protein